MIDVTDLIERLRNADVVDYPNTAQDLCEEAADALERLTRPADVVPTLSDSCGAEWACNCRTGYCAIRDTLPKQTEAVEAERERCARIAEAKESGQ